MLLVILLYFLTVMPAAISFFICGSRRSSVSPSYSNGLSSDFNKIWCAAADFGFKDSHVTKYQNIANSKWQTAAILKIVFWLYLHDLLSN